MKSLGIALCLAVAFGAAFRSAGAAPIFPHSPVLQASPTETIQYLPRSGFPNPRVRGAVVDWCSTWANNCGPGGATLFCQAHGFASALSWDVIQTTHTYVIGSSRFCDESFCKGYSFIRCG